LKDTDDPLIYGYHIRHARQNPLKTAILKRALKTKGNPPKENDGFPQALKQYIEKHGFRDEASTQQLLSRILISGILQLTTNRGPVKTKPLGTTLVWQQVEQLH